MKELLCVGALLGDVEDLDVVLGQRDLLHAVGRPVSVPVGQQEPHRREERVRLHHKDT